MEYLCKVVKVIAWFCLNAFFSYGFVTNTKIKFILVIDSGNIALRENEVRAVSTKIHKMEFSQFHYKFTFVRISVYCSEGKSVYSYKLNEIWNTIFPNYAKWLCAAIGLKITVVCYTSIVGIISFIWIWNDKNKCSLESRIERQRRLTLL